MLVSFWIGFRADFLTNLLRLNSASLFVQYADGNLIISAAEGKDVLIEGGDGVQVDLLAIEPAIQAELKASVDSAAIVADERERKSEYVWQRAHLIDLHPTHLFEPINRCAWVCLNACTCVGLGAFRFPERTCIIS